jgi:hypothetical protein
MSSWSDRAQRFGEDSRRLGQPVGVSCGAWILGQGDPEAKSIEWQLSHDVPSAEATFAILDVPSKPAPRQLLDAIRSVKVEAPAGELVRKFIAFYPDLVDNVA